MGDESAETRKTTNWLTGEEIEEHYDKDGKKVGESRTQDWGFGTARQVHYDNEGREVGTTRTEDWGMGAPRQVHHDAEGREVGTTFTEDWGIGTPRQLHYDAQGNKVGESHAGELPFGVPGTQSHHGRNFKTRAATPEASVGVEARSAQPGYPVLPSGYYDSSSQVRGRSAQRSPLVNTLIKTAELLLLGALYGFIAFWLGAALGFVAAIAHWVVDYAATEARPENFYGNVYVGAGAVFGGLFGVLIAWLQVQGRFRTE